MKMIMKCQELSQAAMRQSIQVSEDQLKKEQCSADTILRVLVRF